MKKRKSRMIILAAVLATTCLCGCDLVERAEYDLSGGVEKWENTAIENHIESTVEEYFYDHLPEELQSAYREIYVHIKMNEDSGSFFSSITVDEFWDAYYAVLSDHPEIFWIGSSVQVEESGLTGKVVAYNFDVTVPADSRKTMQAELEAAADACISQIPSDASIYKKIKKVYEYLIQTVEYSSDSFDTQNIQSALLYRASVCAGYSRAFQYILHRMGLFCSYIKGTIRDGGEHGWNMVRIDDKYYYVDVTWGDPVFANSMGDAGQGEALNYNYLCCTEYDLFKTHVPAETEILPACTSDDYNYYKLNGFYYENFDWDTIHNALMNSVWNDEIYIEMKFGSREAYDAAKFELFENGLLSDAGQYLMEINGVSTWNYRYQTDDNFYLITVYWR